MKLCIFILVAIPSIAVVGTTFAADKSEEVWRREVSARLGVKKDGFFVFSTSQTAIVRGRKSASARAKPVVDFHAIEGKDAAIEAIVSFLLDIPSKNKSNDRQSTQSSDPETRNEQLENSKDATRRDWRFVGRYETSSEANNERARREKLYAAAQRRDQLAKERSAAAQLARASSRPSMPGLGGCRT